jgi:hypothetical protein
MSTLQISIVDNDFGTLDIHFGNAGQTEVFIPHWFHDKKFDGESYLSHFHDQEIKNELIDNLDFRDGKVMWKLTYLTLKFDW